jgi:hypothetical protein
LVKDINVRNAEQPFFAPRQVTPIHRAVIRKWKFSSRKRNLLAISSTKKLICFLDAGGCRHSREGGNDEQWFNLSFQREKYGPSVIPEQLKTLQEIHCKEI